MPDKCRFEAMRRGGARVFGVPLLERRKSSGHRVIPGILNIDPFPRATHDGLDAFWVANEKVPSILAGDHDCLVAVPDEVAELVAAQIVPDVLHWLEPRSGSRFRGVGR